MEKQIGGTVIKVGAVTSGESLVCERLDESAAGRIVGAVHKPEFGADIGADCSGGHRKQLGLKIAGV